MQLRHCLRCSGVEPRFFARHPARNPLPSPSCPGLRAIGELPAPAAVLAPPLPALLPRAVPACAKRRVAADPPLVHRPSPGDGSSPSAAPPLASLPDSNVDSVVAFPSHSPFTVKWDFTPCLNLGGHSKPPSPPLDIPPCPSLA